MAGVSFRSVSKAFADGTAAVDRFDLEVEDGELVVLVGPSGCGKSTLLRMVAGLEEVSDGEIRIGEERVNELAPQSRDVAMVFQNYALYPHMTVRQNLAFPLRMMGLSRGKIEQRVMETAAILALGPLLGRRPGQLSGGQRQRVAMGRALVREPEVFLLDEPLSNLDAKLRVQMRAEITALQRRLGTTTLYVTHDQVEAMTMGQRLAVLRQGRLQQAGTPQKLYEAPANVFVASFIGSPAMNLFVSRLESGPSGRPGFRIGDRLLPLGARVVEAHRGALERGLGEVIIGLRPEAFVPPDQVAEEERIELAVAAVELMGHEQLVHLRAPLQRPRPELLASDAPAPGAASGATTEPADSDSVTLVARLQPDLRLAAGENAKIGLDTNRFYLFDADGASLRKPGE